MKSTAKEFGQYWVRVVGSAIGKTRDYFVQIALGYLCLPIADYFLAHPRGTKRLFLFLTNLDDSFDFAILWTDHEKHPLMLWVSFKERGIIFLI